MDLNHKPATLKQKKAATLNRAMAQGRVELKALQEETLDAKASALDAKASFLMAKIKYGTVPNYVNVLATSEPLIGEVVLVSHCF